MKRLKRNHSELKDKLDWIEEQANDLCCESDDEEPATEASTATIAFLMIRALNELTLQVAALNRSIFHYPEHQDDTDQQNTTPGL